MKKILLSCSFLLGLLSTHAYAETCGTPIQGWYLGGAFGVSHIDENFETGPQMGLTIGYRYSPSLRFEGEFSHSINRLKHTDLDLNTAQLTANILYDISIPLPLRPYLGIGGGKRQVRIDTGEEVFQASEYVYQGIGGLMMPIGEWQFVSLEYRHLRGEENHHPTHAAAINLKRYF